MGADWIEEARIQAAKLELGPDAAERVAQLIATWMDTAAQNQRNADYWQSLYREVNTDQPTVSEGGVTAPA